jgi:hypothetical protein
VAAAVTLVLGEADALDEFAKAESVPVGDEESVVDGVLLAVTVTVFEPDGVAWEQPTRSADPAQRPTTRRTELRNRCSATTHFTVVPKSERAGRQRLPARSAVQEEPQ